MSVPVIYRYDNNSFLFVLPSLTIIKSGLTIRITNWLTVIRVEQIAVFVKELSFDQVSLSLNK